MEWLSINKVVIIYNIVNYINIFSQINNDLVEYTVNEIESEFNNEYDIFHKNVVILIENTHNIELNKLKRISKILNYEIIFQNDIIKPLNRFKCYNEKTLSIYFEQGHFSKIKPDVYIPDLISFNSNASETKSLSGNLYPEFQMVNGKKEYLKPKTFFVCSIDIEE